MTDERKPPKKIRVTKLQEAQVLDLTRIDADVAALFHEIGLTEVSARNDIDFARLTRNHDVLVAEADETPAGFLIWADQPPGVAWLPTLEVDPMHQRMGIGTRMLREIGEVALGHGIEYVVSPCWTKAPWAMSFLAVRGFQQLEGGTPTPDKLNAWLELRQEEAVPGQSLWWSKTDGLGTIPGLPRPESVRFT
jgi:GNAT superfamily N-acetyltransferase